MNPAYCYGTCTDPSYKSPVSSTYPFRIEPLSFSFTGQFNTFDGFREGLEGKLAQEPEEKKPLEWSEVEQQLDDFMATLNGRNADA